MIRHVSRKHHAHRRPSVEVQKTGAQNAALLASIDAQGNFRFGADARPVTREQLKKEFVVAVSKKSDTRLVINTDRATPFGKIVQVMDAAKEANIASVYANVREPEKQ